MANQDSPTFENQLVELDSVDSTNNYAMARIHDGTASNGQIYLAHTQTAGKGQRGKSWYSEPGQNLSMSLVIKPGLLPLTQQFLFSAAVALGILDFTKNFVKENWSIKWPNDIYWNDRKAAGILVENVIQGLDWRFAVVGIGINLNQQSFPPELPNAVSLGKITGSHYPVVGTAKLLIPFILKRVNIFKDDSSRTLTSLNDNLYKKNKYVKLKKENKLIRARILNVSDMGQLFTDKGLFSLGEVEWIINETSSSG
jgi:BirA family transcriptional regulator, biotin operon repressor / biotin---[acetyl-CoA-carboxylase] ligase